MGWQKGVPCLAVVWVSLPASRCAGAWWRRSMRRPMLGRSCRAMARRPSSLLWKSISERARQRVAGAGVSPWGIWGVACGLRWAGMMVGGSKRESRGRRTRSTVRIQTRTWALPSARDRDSPRPALSVFNPPLTLALTFLVHSSHHAQLSQADAQLRMLTSAPCATVRHTCSLPSAPRRHSPVQIPASCSSSPPRRPRLLILPPRSRNHTHHRPLTPIYAPCVSVSAAAPRRLLTRHIFSILAESRRRRIASLASVRESDPCTELALWPAAPLSR